MPQWIELVPAKKPGATRVNMWEYQNAFSVEIKITKLWAMNGFEMGNEMSWPATSDPRKLPSFYFNAHFILFISLMLRNLLFCYRFG